MLACRAVGPKKSTISSTTSARSAGTRFEVLDAGEAQEVVGNVDQPLALALQALDALQGPAFALGLRLLEVLGQELQVQAERAEVVLDLVDEAAGQLGQLGVRVVQRLRFNRAGVRRGAMVRRAGGHASRAGPVPSGRRDGGPSCPGAGLFCSRSSALRDSLTRSWSSMAITLTCSLSPTLHDVLDLVDVLVVQLADVAQAVAAGQDLDEGAEVLDRRDPALVDLADAHLLGQRLDLELGRLGAGGVACARCTRCRRPRCRSWRRSLPGCP